MQIGGRWRLENRKRSSKHSSWILCNFGECTPCRWCHAHLLLFSGQDRKGKYWSLLQAATEPPTTTPTSAAHSKLARASRGLRLSVARNAFPVFFRRNVSSNSSSNTQDPIVDVLGHNPASPPLPCKKATRAAVPPVQTEKTDPLCFACPFQASTEVHDPPLLPPATLKASKHSHFSFLLVGGNEAEHLKRFQKIYS